MSLKVLFIPAFASIFAAALILSTSPRISAAIPVGADACVYPSTATVFFADQILLSHDAGGAIYDRDISLAAGTYNISTLSSDLQHPNDPIPNQLEEYWYFQLLADNGKTIIYTSPITTDLPNDDKTIEDVNLDTNVELTQDAMRIRYIHAAYPENVTNPSDLMYNSVAPSCVAFEPVASIVLPVCNVQAELSDDNSSIAELSVSTNQDDNYTINWGDSTLETIVSGTEMITHEYSSPGTYNITVSVGDATCDNEVTIGSSTPGVLGDSITVEPETPASEDSTEAVLGSSTLANTGTGSTSTVLAGIVIVITAHIATRYSRTSST